MSAKSPVGKASVTMKSCCKVFKFVFGKSSSVFERKKSIFKNWKFWNSNSNILKNGKQFEFWNIVFRDTVYVCDCPCPISCPNALYSMFYCIVQRASQYRSRIYCQNLNLAVASQFGGRVSIWQPHPPNNRESSRNLPLVCPWSFCWSKASDSGWFAL